MFKSLEIHISRGTGYFCYDQAMLSFFLCISVMDNDDDENSDYLILLCYL